ncbi:MAG: HD domain-containing protein [Acidobacteriota bacterium]
MRHVAAQAEALDRLARRLIRQRIKGLRKGATDQMLYRHSIRVSDRLRRHGYPKDVVLAGLLHDIVEDGDTTLAELRGLGFSSRTVRLVDLSSHDRSDTDKNRRWARMVDRLRRARDPDAWALKTCDVIDNLYGCPTIPDEEKRWFFVEVKGPMFLRLVYPVLGRTRLYEELVDASTEFANARFRRLLREG